MTGPSENEISACVASIATADVRIPSLSNDQAKAVALAVLRTPWVADAIRTPPVPNYEHTDPHLDHKGRCTCTCDPCVALRELVAAAAASPEASWLVWR